MRPCASVIALMLICGCVSIPANENEPSSTSVPGGSHDITSASTIPVPTDKAYCLAIGGRWGIIGMSANESCNPPTSDSGRLCRDSSECEGACIADLTADEMARLTPEKPISSDGACTPWRFTRGCHAWVEEGKVNGILCAD